MAETEQTGLLRSILAGQEGRTEPGMTGYGYTDASGNRVSALRDMFDGGGAMARGGRFEGGGLLSMIGNLANSVLGRDMGKRSAYFAKKPMRKPMPMQNNSPQMVNNPMMPDMSMQPMEGVTVPFTNPYAVGGGFEATAPSAFPVADVASPVNTAKVTPQQNMVEEIATNIVADEMGVGFFTLPSVERQRLVQNKINELTIAMGM